MSKLPDAIGRLSRPLQHRDFRAEMYVVGKVATHEVDHGILPMVSSYAQKDFDDDFKPVWRVRTVYCYNSRMPLKIQTWHQFGEDQFIYDVKEAVALAESQCREAYDTSLERAIARALDERV